MRKGTLEDNGKDREDEVKNEKETKEKRKDR